MSGHQDPTPPCHDAKGAAWVKASLTASFGAVLSLIMAHQLGYYVTVVPWGLGSVLGDRLTISLAGS